jgi:hypothetical protein
MVIWGPMVENLGHFLSYFTPKNVHKNILEEDQRYIKTMLITLCNFMLLNFAKKAADFQKTALGPRALLLYVLLWTNEASIDRTVTPCITLFVLPDQRLAFYFMPVWNIYQYKVGLT